MITTTESTESRILAAAEAEFMQKGYAGARTSSIAEEAGVTHAMLHYYFRTKKNLFDKIVSEKFTMLREIMLSSLGDNSLPFFERIRNAICEHLDFIAKQPDLPRFMIVEVFYQPERMEIIKNVLSKYTIPLINNIQKEIDQIAERGECRRVDATMLLLDIISLNIFSFISAPILNPLVGGIMDNMHDFVERRKIENVETIMRKLGVSNI